MTKKIIVIGSKPSRVLDFSPIIDEFDNNIRINLALPGYNNGTKYDRQILNNHVCVNVNDMSTFKDKYKSKCEDKYLDTFVEKFDKSNYSKIYPQTNDMNIYNSYLKSIGCPYIFEKGVRCGFNGILNALTEGFDVCIAGYSLSSDSRSYYATCDTSNLHDPDREILILRWMHHAGIIDASLCLFEDSKPLTIDGRIGLQPSATMLSKVKNLYGDTIIVKIANGISIVHNLYTPAELEQIETEYHRLFEEHCDLIEILDKEGCSNDERIFNAQTHSEILRTLITDNKILNQYVKTYTNRAPTTDKLLINRLKYEDGKVKNSGAGWHRDNHDCQFKTMIYLSDVSDKNGNFQFMLNSSPRHIGWPPPRAPNHNTRFTDDTVDQILKAPNSPCKIINIGGSRGTVMLVDTTYIHRGNIIKEGERFAATQYYF